MKNIYLRSYNQLLQPKFSLTFVAIAIIASLSIVATQPVFAVSKLPSGSSNAGVILDVDGSTPKENIIDKDIIYTGTINKDNSEQGAGLLIKPSNPVANLPNAVDSLTNNGTLIGGNHSIVVALEGNDSSSNGLQISDVVIKKVTNNGTIKSGESTVGAIGDSVQIINGSQVGEFINNGLIAAPTGSLTKGGAAISVHKGSSTPDKPTTATIINNGQLIGGDMTDPKFDPGMGIYVGKDNGTTATIYNAQTGVIKGGDNQGRAGIAGIYIASGTDVDLNAETVKIINDGKISGGCDRLSANSCGLSIDFTKTSGNTLELWINSQIIGGIYSDKDTWQHFVLGGNQIDKQGSFDLSQLIGDGWGNGSSTYIKNGSSTWNLQGNANNNMTTNWSIDQGRLNIDKQTTTYGAINVNNSGVLGGHGLINGNVAIKNGGTLAVGNGSSDSDFGTLTANNIDFQSGSTYQVKVNDAGKSDLLKSNNQVTIHQNSILDIQAADGKWEQDVKYKIIETAKGVTGAFNTVTSNLAFLTTLVDYNNANEVWLTMQRNNTSFASTGKTYNQKHTAEGIESLGKDNDLYKQIVTQSAETTPLIYDNLSGEIHASVKSAALVNSTYTRNAVSQHLDNGQGILTELLDNGKSVWLSTWGHKGHIKDDGNAAQVNNNTWGTLLGIDVYQSNSEDNTVVGFAAGYGGSNINIDKNRNSHADMDAVHLLTYGRTSINNFHFKGLLGYSWLDIDTRRKIHVGEVFGTNKASYDGNLLQATLEASYQFSPSVTSRLSPYVNIGYQQVKTDSFTEKGDTKSSVARLHNHSKRDDIFTTTIGLKNQWLVSTMTTIYSDLGWMHSYGNATPEVNLNFMDGAKYNLKGAQIDRNSAVMGLGALFQLNSAMQLSLGYEGLSGDQTKNHGAQAKFEYAF